MTPAILLIGSASALIASDRPFSSGLVSSFCSFQPSPARYLASSVSTSLELESWRSWREPFRTTYADYVSMQTEKDAAVYAVRDVVGKAEDYEKLPAEWKSGASGTANRVSERRSGPTSG